MYCESEGKIMKNVIITILAVLVIALGGFLIYDKVVNKCEKCDTKVEEKTNSNNFR